VTTLFHLCTASAWEGVPDGYYRGSTRGVTLEEQGFIHCSLAHQVRTVADAIYADADGLVLLVIDDTRLDAPVRYEGGFPHIYGPLPVSAVVDVVPVGRDSSGDWTGLPAG